MKLQLLTGLWLGAALMVQAQGPTSTAEGVVHPSESAVTFTFRSGTPRIYNTTMVKVQCGVDLRGQTFNDFANITLYSRINTSVNAASLSAASILGANIETPSMQEDRRSEEPPNFSTNLLFQRTIIGSQYFLLDTNLSEIVIQPNSLQGFKEELLFFTIFQNGDDTRGSSSPYFAVRDPSSGTFSTFIDNNTELLSTSDTAELDPTSSNTSSGNGSSETGEVAMPGQGTGHKGGLATGAIAGIAVGAAIALILVAALVWYILRRRRQRISPHPTDVSTPLAAGYRGAGGMGSRDFMGDKEAGAMVAESPESQAYTDQPDPRHSTLSGAAIIGGATAAPANASYTESGHQAYDEAVPTDHSPTDQQPPHHGSASGIHGVDSPVPSASVARHLVDEDMTADEIARLEEEERELDRQIQEARRRQ